MYLILSEINEINPSPVMTPQQLLSHYDVAQLWSSAPGLVPGFGVATAYQSALAVRDSVY